ncbi:hypothetical protein PSTEL_00510 [Paenibacillus stellifer]|uniref:Uncharacterized protein n=1 Tax=Paenibacillus stellifer TaxID=169760 RepID=A0A089LRL7_9BACL|nr:hypothetical protein PSTEL_00510 [Paenibacillus stellifer]
MSRFKVSTQNKIDQHIKELLRPKLIVGAIYQFRGHAYDPIVERKVLSVDERTVTYQKPTGPATCSISTFQRLYESHGVGMVRGEVQS